MSLPASTKIASHRFGASATASQSYTLPSTPTYFSLRTASSSVSMRSISVFGSCRRRHDFAGCYLHHAVFRIRVADIQRIVRPHHCAYVEVLLESSGCNYLRSPLLAVPRCFSNRAKIAEHDVRPAFTIEEHSGRSPIEIITIPHHSHILDDPFLVFLVCMF